MAAHDDSVIVTGVDGSRVGLEASLWAAALAARLGCPLRIVHALPDAPSSAADNAVIRQGSAAAAARETGELVLNETLVLVRERWPHLEMRADLVPGPPARALAAASADARMVVIGNTGAGALRTRIIGSTAIALTKHASCPVTIWQGQPGAPSDHRPIVVGVDDAELSAGAVRQAFNYAHLVDAPVVAVHAWSAYHHTVGGTVPYVLDLDQIERDERVLLTARLAAAVRAFPDVTVTHTVTRRDPRRALAERATEAQLVVVGSSGHGRLAGAVLGSVSHYLLHHSTCPAMVCPATTGGPDHADKDDKDDEDIRSRAAAFNAYNEARRAHLVEDEPRQIDSVRKHLSRKYPDTDPGTIDEAVSWALRRFDGTKVRDFVPLLVERAATETLDDTEHL
ncbi:MULTISPECIES: universal stress protein [Rhodococcus]|uniref:universal stress protein n=1 Tax=Rhodococcus TaxID=1827 RepID=UPI0002D4FE56|nr:MULTISPECIES: universal stress protein [Rhodococcus]QQZ14450.1 universal stress protein [Rhodococcus sp. 21391]